jgi:hypothetical protein
MKFDVSIVDKPDTTQDVMLRVVDDDGMLPTTIVLLPSVARQIGRGMASAADNCSVLSISTAMPRGESEVN